MGNMGLSESNRSNGSHEAVNQNRVLSGLLTRVKDSKEEGGRIWILGQVKT